MPRVPKLYPHPLVRRQRGMPKTHLQIPVIIVVSIGVNNLVAGEKEGRIMIMFQNMVGMGDESYQSNQHKLDTFRIL